MSSTYTSPTSVRLYMGLEIALSVLAVLLRVAARYYKSASIGMDDVLIYIVLAMYLVYCGISLSWLDRGLWVDDAPNFTIDQIRTTLIENIAGGLMVVWALTLTRLSVCALYRRLFSINQVMNIGLLCVALTSTAWSICLTLIICFRCRPIRAAYEPTIIPEWCANMQTALLVTELINALLDFALVLLPLPILLKLQLPWKERIGLAAVFLIGGFVGVVSILRLAITYDPTATIYRLDTSQFYIALQLSSGIVAACLPTLRPFLSSRYFPTAVLRSVLVSLRTLSHRSSSSDRSRRADRNSTKPESDPSDIRSKYPWQADNTQYENLERQKAVQLDGVSSTTVEGNTFNQSRFISSDSDNIMVHNEVSVSKG